MMENNQFQVPRLKGKPIVGSFLRTYHGHIASSIISLFIILLISYHIASAQHPTETYALSSITIQDLSVIKNQTQDLRALSIPKVEQTPGLDDFSTGEAPPPYPTETYALSPITIQNLFVIQDNTQNQSAISIPRIEQTPTMDDFSTGQIPLPFLVVDEFRQYSPGDAILASQPTSAGIAYDDENLYIVFISRDNPDLVRGRMSKRENISGDDTVTVYLDTFNSGQSAYKFTANPLGIQLDGIRTNKNGTDERFDTVWSSEGEITDFGYVVLFAIPFKSLRFSKDLDQKWGIALGRSIKRKDESSFWPYITRRKSSFLQQLGKIELSGVSRAAISGLFPMPRTPMPGFSMKAVPIMTLIAIFKAESMLKRCSTMPTLWM